MDKNEAMRLAKIGAEAFEQLTGKRPYFFEAVLVGAIMAKEYDTIAIKGVGIIKIDKTGEQK